jgi:hypothetical protein
MDYLKELIYVVNRNKIKQIDLLDLKKRKGSKVNQLYQMASENESLTDEDAFQVLFPDAGSKNAYYNLKATLKKKLLNTLFFIDIRREGQSDRQVAFFDLHKDLSAARFLLAKNALVTSLSELEKVLKKALHYEFIEIALDATRLLRMQCATKGGDFREYQKYKSAYKEYERIDRLESLAEEYYADLVVHYVKDKSQKQNLRDLARRYHAELEESCDGLSTYKFRLHSYLIHLFCYTSLNDYVGAIPLCEEMIAFFHEKPFDVVPATQIALHHQLVGYLQLKDYGTATVVANKSLFLLEEGSFNWFKNLEYQLLLALRLVRYQDAYEVYNKALGHRQYSSLPESIKEMWGIYQAYLHLLVDINKISLTKEDKKFTTFRINKFLNSTPIYSKDKRGMNISILIIHILFYIRKKEFDKAIDRIEAIEKYCTRYLSKSETLKSFHFIKLLQTLPRASFNFKLVQTYAEERLKALKEADSKVSSFHKIEVIPYENLWDMITSFLRVLPNEKCSYSRRRSSHK